jgi:hypothetical protein
VVLIEVEQQVEALAIQEETITIIAMLVDQMSWLNSCKRDGILKLDF